MIAEAKVKAKQQLEEETIVEPPVDVRQQSESWVGYEIGEMSDLTETLQPMVSAKE